MRDRRAVTAAVASLILVSAGATFGSMADPRPPGEYQAARARAEDMGKHLGASLGSANAYERLFALEYIDRNPAAATVAMAPQLATLIADRTKLLSLRCMGCKVDCAMCDGCWGPQGNSDCGWLRDVSESARGTLTVLAKGPLRQPLADALWPIALRSEPDAAAVATLMPAFSEAFRSHVAGALDGPAASRALRLVANFPPGKCGNGDLAATLARRMADGAPLVRARAALAVVVCNDGSAAWTGLSPVAISRLATVLADPRDVFFEELPAVAQVVEPLAGAIGQRMSNRAATDARLGVRLLQAAPSAAGAALLGLRSRLMVSDVEESVALFTIIAEVGPKAAPLKPAVIAAARRTGAVYWAIAALGAMHSSLSNEERGLLKRLYRSECSSRDCEPFSRAMADAFGAAKR
jgi:hypothetical protein